MIGKQARMSATARVLTDNAADTVRGILLVAVSYLILTIGDTAATWAIMGSGVAWVLLWRGVFGAAAVAAVTGVAQGARGLAAFRQFGGRWFWRARRCRRSRR